MRVCISYAAGVKQILENHFNGKPQVRMQRSLPCIDVLARVQDFRIFMIRCLDSPLLLQRPDYLIAEGGKLVSPAYTLGNSTKGAL